ncbi:MAG: cupin domain-containing protein [Nitrolancea sp.]
MSSDAQLLDLLGVAAQGGRGAILSRETEDLDLNLVRFSDGAGVASHVNREVDVLLVAMSGSGTVAVGDDQFLLEPGQSLLIPKNTVRSVVSPASGEFVYLSVHRRRSGLLPRRLGVPQPNPIV